MSRIPLLLATSGLLVIFIRNHPLGVRRPESLSLIPATYPDRLKVAIGRTELGV